MKKISETAVRSRARRVGFRLRKVTSDSYELPNIRDGKSPFQRGYQHPRALTDISKMVENFSCLRALVRGG